MDGFIRKLKAVFGDVSYSLRIDHRGILKCRIPRIIGEICQYVYSVNSFGSFDSRISLQIFELNKDCQFAFIVAAVLDEGSITYDGYIQFGVSNKRMMEDLARLCKKVGLETTKIIEGGLGRYHFYIKPLDKFYNLYSQLSKKFSHINLDYKEERLRKALEIKKQKFFYTQDFADKRKLLILNDLKKCGQSVNFLSSKFLISPRTIRRYMYKLIKEDKVSREKINNEYVYRLN